MAELKQDNLVTPHYAGFWIRFFASLIDIVVTSPLLIVVMYLFGTNQYASIKISDGLDYYSSMQSLSQGNHNVDLISYLVLIVYSVFFVASKKQATIGKRMMGIYIATKDDRELGKLQALLRFLFSIVSIMFFGLGVLMIAFTEEKTAFHDLVCGTRVFYGKKV